MRISRRRRYGLILAASAIAIGGIAAGCGDDDDDGNGGEDLSGSITIDGSSTVAPMSEAAAEQFQAENSGVRVTVGTSGTGGGFEKFCRGETDISDASRSIKDEEIQACADAGISYEEITVGNDGLSVAVNLENDWAQCLTVEQLGAIWGPDSDVSNWNEVDPSFPDEELVLFGPGTDSGTFDFFTEAINGEEGAQRTDYNNVGEDDNASVTGVQGNTGGMAYFGFSFIQVNQDKVRAVEVDGGNGCTAPSIETVQSGEYSPLGRGLFIYPSGTALQEPEVQAFARFYIENNDAIATQALAIPLSDEQRTTALDQIDTLVSGGGE
ncbi:MAG: PstS family phosphate ABC transporter substrate-binding protein [Miltoncostaeaceae bacterium]